MVDLDHMEPEDAPGTLAFVTMLSKSIHRAVADRDGSTAQMKQIIALSYLRELGAVGQKYLGAVLCLDANNTVLLLNQLEGDGLIVRQRDPEDRRRHVVELTDAGHAILRNAEVGMTELEDEILAALEPEQRVQLGQLLHQALYGENGVFRRATAGIA